jgi:predicted transglutaminase-like cysteine proteinase
MWGAMAVKYIAIALGGVFLMASIHGAVTSATRLTATTPTLPPFAHTQFCMKYPDDCKADGNKNTVKSVPLTPQRRDELRVVNDQVNKSIVPQTQPANPVHEKWVLNPRAGDCNDYVVTKRHALIRKGWRADALLPTEAVLPSGEHHLVLIARTGEGDFVLDNLKDRVRTVADASMDYKWVRMVSPRDPRYWNKVEQPS